VRTRNVMLATLALGLAATGCSGWPGAAAGGDAASVGSQAPGVRALRAAEAAPLLDDPDVVVLDIRTPPEVAQARLPGAVALDFYAPDFSQQLAQLDRSATYLMYCRSGNRSASARGLMTQLGFEDVVDVRGGIIEWVDAGLPIER
jgi:phage shock protein E